MGEVQVFEVSEVRVLAIGLGSYLSTADSGFKSLRQSRLTKDYSNIKSRTLQNPSNTH